MTARITTNNGSTNSICVPSHSHRESTLHWVIEKIAGIVFDFSKAIDYATQWVDYSDCSPELKENAVKVKSSIDRVNVVFAGCATAVAVHELLDAEAPGVGEVAGFLSSGAEFLDRLDDFGAINLMEGASPVIGAVGIASDLVGGLYDSASVLSNGHIQPSDSRGLAGAKLSPLYKLVKIAENVAFIALAALSGYATYCAVFAVAAHAALPFALLAVGTAALSIKMMRCFYEGLADDGQARNLVGQRRQQRMQSNCNPQNCGATNGQLTSVDVEALRTENFDLKMRTSKLEGVIEGLRIGIDSWARKPINYFFNGVRLPNPDEFEDGDDHSSQSDTSQRPNVLSSNNGNDKIVLENQQSLEELENQELPEEKV